MSVPSGHFKVGVATDPWRRVRELQTGCHEPITCIGATLPADPCEVTISAYEFEGRLHRILSGCRTTGEWFKISEEAIYVLMNHIWDRLVIERAARKAKGGG